MKIEVIGLARDLRTGTPVAYAQMSIEDYLEVVGDEFENFTIQRRRETHKAYQRLKLDIEGGALLPSITLAVKPDRVSDILPLFEAAELGGSHEDLAQALAVTGQVDILDGLQRTYIIHDLKSDGHKFVSGQKILTEFWLEDDINRLIYRIIVLNAGQKPMSIRHQVELLFMSLKTSIEGVIADLEIYTERDNTRRNRSRKFSLNVIVSAYQSFITSSSEHQKDNVIANQLLASNALDSSEQEIAVQFDVFSRYLNLYAQLDDQVTRIYKNAATSLKDLPIEEAEPSGGMITVQDGSYANWLATENVMSTFFAAISQYAGNETKQKRVDDAVEKLLDLLKNSDVGSDPLGLEVFSKLRVGLNPRRVNVGVATRKLLTNGFKEFFRESGDAPLTVCWTMGAE